MGNKKPSYNSLGNSAVHKVPYDYPGVHHNRKYTCEHYDRESGLCDVLNIACVGPWNDICKDFNPIDEETIKPQTRIGQNAQFGGNPEPWKRKNGAKPNAAIAPKPPTQTVPKKETKPRPVPSISASDIQVGSIVTHVGEGDCKVICLDEEKGVITLRTRRGKVDFAFPYAFERGILMKK